MSDPQSPDSPPQSRQERVNRICDAFERQWQAGQQPRIEACLEGAPADDRELLLRELLALKWRLRDRICDAFERRWQAGQQPRIEDCLDRAVAGDREQLLRELLALEWQLRADAGEQPDPDEYRQRFPQDVAVVDASWTALKQCRPVPPDSTADAAAKHDTAEAISPASREVDLRVDAGVPGTRDDEVAGGQAGCGSRAVRMGRTFGVYEILEEIGRGGMGTVYRARQRVLQKQVAIKLMLPGRPFERFRREARLLAQLDSPYVVTVLDFGMLDESPMLVMEWVEGRDLARALQEHGGRIEEAEALPLMIQVGRGLAAAAERGIVHRDLKPSNILIDTKGRARVADFGLARGLEDPDTVSSTCGLMGTPFYMAPEQAEDPRNVDTRADVYSFGATFYHVLTGVPPFVGETAFATFFKAKTEPLVSPRARVPALSDRTGELIERCLAKSPSARFSSFEEVLRQLTPTVATPSPWDEPDDPSMAAILTRYRERKPIYLTRRDELDSPDIYTLVSGCKLIVTRGSIIRQKVDALVSSDDELLSMGGGVSESLRYAAGPEMVAEARKYTPVRAGRAIVTSAGRLPARFIFHGVTLDSSKYESILPSRDLILEVMASCFYHADTLNVRTIAFPLLGTGQGGFPVDVCLDTMFPYLARALTRGVTSVQEARIVLFFPE